MGFDELRKKYLKPQTPEEAAIVQAMEEQQGLKNIGQRLTGGQIPQRDMPNKPKELKPYKSEYINKPGEDIGSQVRAGEYVDKAISADKQRKLDELADLEMMAEFDNDPNSDVNQKIRNLKAFLGK